jgi:hypothetical protein
MRSSVRCVPVRCRASTFLGDSSADAWDLAKPTFFDNRPKRLRERQETFRGPEVGARLEGAVAAQFNTLAELAKQAGDFACLKLSLLVSCGHEILRQ